MASSSKLVIRLLRLRLDGCHREKSVDDFRGRVFDLPIAHLEPLHLFGRQIVLDEAENMRQRLPGKSGYYDPRGDIAIEISAFGQLTLTARLCVNLVAN